MIYRISGWFRYKTGPETQPVSTSERVTGAVRGIFSTLFSVKFFVLLKAFLPNVVLQTKLLQQDALRWLMHMCIYWGFMILLLMHALEQHISAPLFDNYYSTLNPFMFLRDLSGVLVLLGIGIAVYRRVVLRSRNLSTGAQDIYAIIILSILMLSGIFLESAKIISHTRFMEMVEEYADPEDEEESCSLEAYWVKYFSVVSPDMEAPFDEDLLVAGEEAPMRPAAWNVTPDPLGISGVRWRLYPQALISACVTCRLQMSDVVVVKDLDIEIYDISEFVAQCL